MDDEQTACPCAAATTDADQFCVDCGRSRAHGARRSRSPLLVGLGLWLGAVGVCAVAVPGGRSAVAATQVEASEVTMASAAAVAPSEPVAVLAAPSPEPAPPAIQAVVPSSAAVAPQPEPAPAQQAAEEGDHDVPVGKTEPPAGYEPRQLRGNSDSTAPTLITDIGSWHHATHAVLDKTGIAIQQVVLTRTKTYPTFHVTMPAWGNHDQGRTAVLRLYDELCAANAGWNYALHDSKTGNTTTVLCAGKKAVGGEGIGWGGPVVAVAVDAPNLPELPEVDLVAALLTAAGKPNLAALFGAKRSEFRALLPDKPDSNDTQLYITSYYVKLPPVSQKLVLGFYHGKLLRIGKYFHEPEATLLPKLAAFGQADSKEALGEVTARDVWKKEDHVLEVIHTQGSKPDCEWWLLDPAAYDDFTKEDATSRKAFALVDHAAVLLTQMPADTVVAMADYRQAVALLPAYARTWLRLCKLEVEGGDLEAARRDCDEAVKRTSIPGVRTEAAGVLRKMGR